jgi:hypothetical protein
VLAVVVPPTYPSVRLSMRNSSAEALAVII